MIAMKNNESFQYRILLALTGLVVLFPVSCNYIMEGGIIGEWVARMCELSEGGSPGGFPLFASAEAIASTGIPANGMDSNLWFFLPALVYRLGNNLVFAYRSYMLAIQAGTLAASILLFGRIFSHSESKLPVFFGVLLYMTCPYRIYVCYDLGDLSQTAAWMLLPVYLWAILGLLQKEGNQIWNLTAAALSLAGIGYGDTVFFLIAAGVTLPSGLAKRRLSVLIAPIAGSLLFLPGLYRLFQYLFRNGFQDLNMPLGSIMPKGYPLGSYFSSYAFREGHPGMGLGMVICLLTGIWLFFVTGRKPSMQCKVFTGTAAFFILLSYIGFPWDYFQRLGDWALKLISLIETPAIFFGMAYLFLCVPAASAIKRIRQYENKTAAYAVPLLVMLACYGICIYQCNNLTYTRPPLP